MKRKEWKKRTWKVTLVSILIILVSFVVIKPQVVKASYYSNTQILPLTMYIPSEKGECVDYIYLSPNDFAYVGGIGAAGLGAKLGGGWGAAMVIAALATYQPSYYDVWYSKATYRRQRHVSGQGYVTEMREEIFFRVKYKDTSRWAVYNYSVGNWQNWYDWYNQKNFNTIYSW